MVTHLQIFDVKIITIWQFIKASIIQITRSHHLSMGLQKYSISAEKIQKPLYLILPICTGEY